VGYVVPAMDKTITVSMLRGYLKEMVPEFMVPAAFVILKEFPLTPNGKADRRALPAPNGLRPELDSPYVPPRTELERMIAAIWQSVLSLEITGMNDNFFDLGGDSLRMIQVHDTLREIVKQELTILDMFEYPTISSLAEYLSAGRADGHASLNGEIGDRTANQTKEKARLKRLGNRSERPGRGGAR
jgi:acyl carrier protein